MSAYGVGRESGAAALARGGAPDLVGKVIRWIPGDALAFYTAFVSILADSAPSLWLLLAAAALCAILVIAGYKKSNGTVNNRAWVLAGLAVVAFAIWSLAIPASGWYEIDWIAEHPEVTGAIAAGLGIAFAAVADAFVPD